MNFEQFVEKIGFEPETAGRLVARRRELEFCFGVWREAFFRDSESAIEANRERFSPADWLCLFCMLAAELHEVYRERGISEEIYFDTFSDLAIWNRQCRFQTGEDGLKELDWLANHLNLRLFRLGRLQFERRVCGEDLSIGGKQVSAGEEALFCHIPRGGPLFRDEVRRSYAKASAFFGERAVLCESWLLSPTLGELLAPDSNILRFAEDYEILHVDPDSRSGERYIFGEIKEDRAAYAPDSAFAERVKLFLLSGRRLGEATGGLWPDCVTEGTCGGDWKV